MKPENDRQLQVEARALLDHEMARRYWGGMPFDEQLEFITKARAALAHEHFLKDTAPLRHAIAQVYATFLPTRMLVSKADGTLEMTSADTLTPEASKGIEQLETHIREIAKDWGLTLALPIDAIKDGP